MNLDPLPSVTRMGSHAHHYLTAAPRSGVVASNFTGGINVLFDQGTTPRHIVVQHELIPLHPWAIEYNVPSNMAVGTHCAATDNILQIGSNLTLKIQETEVCALSISPWSRREVHHAKQHLVRLKESLGKRLDTGFYDRLADQFGRSARDLFDGDLEDLLQDITGLGEGSTPCGDDFIVGRLAICWALQTVPEHSSGEIAKIQAPEHWEELMGRTPLPSAQMLRAAMDGSFSEAVFNVMQDLGQPDPSNADTAILDLTSQGGTSGLATVAGIVNGLMSPNL